MRILSFLVAITLSCSVFAESKSRAHAKAVEAASVLNEFMQRGDQAIPTSLLKHSECVMVIPHMIRAGFILGGRSGWGVTSCRTAKGWSPAAYHKMSGISAGFLAGFEKLNIVLVFTNRAAIDALSSKKVSLGADLSVTAGPLGRGLEAGTDYKLDSPVYSYSRGKGLYAGASVNGSVLKPLDNYNALVYGQNVSTREILTGTGMANISTTQPFIDALNQYVP